ncbi:hypothetical protein [Streptomyces sp. NPDC007991]|uniref:hypothetical protein n=1 Tax=Streptomyces sp. NPDC007991 TaxID=3364803 RepID=UPI0036E46A33
MTSELLLANLASAFATGFPVALACMVFLMPKVPAERTITFKDLPSCTSPGCGSAPYSPPLRRNVTPRSRTEESEAIKSRSQEASIPIIGR